MPTKTPKPHHLSLLTVSSVLVIISAVFIMTQRSTLRPQSQPAPTPTTMPTPTDIPGLKVNVNTMSIGDKYGDLVLREIKPFRGSKINLKSNLAVTFQGPITVTGKFVHMEGQLEGVVSRVCSNELTAESKKLLPLLVGSRHNGFCFDNPQKAQIILDDIGSSPELSVTVDNFTLVKCDCEADNTATFIKAN